MKEKKKKNFTDKQKQNFQHHQKSSSTNTKGSSLDRKHRKALQNQTENSKVNANRIILNNNYLKCNGLNDPNKRKRLAE